MHTLRLDNIPGTYLCSIPVRHIPASCPWHISPHIPGIYPCIIPLGQFISLPNGTPHNETWPYILGAHIPGTCLSYIFVRCIPASYRRHISLHIPGTYSCIIPLGQSYRFQMGPNTMTLNHIPVTYLCPISVRHIPASHPWHISPHIPGTHSCIIPQGQSYPCQIGHQCFPPFKV